MDPLVSLTLQVALAATAFTIACAVATVAVLMGLFGLWDYATNKGRKVIDE